MVDKIQLFLMSEKGEAVLKFIIDKYGSEIIIRVVSQQDKGTIDNSFDNIKRLCKKHRISLISRAEFNKSHDPQKIPNVMSLAVGWKWIIKNNHKLIIFHDSLLPRYRGFAPLVNSLVNGEKWIGVSVLLASDGYDSGDIILQKKQKIKYPIKISEAIDIMKNLYVAATNELLRKYVFTGKKIRGKKQNNKIASYSPWLDEDDYVVDWSESSESIKRFVDAKGYPYLGAFTYLLKRKIRIYDVELYTDHFITNRHIGKTIFLVDGKPVVICGQGLLLICNAVFDDDKTSIFPFKKTRLKFYGIKK